MVQQSLDLEPPVVVPTGEAEKRKDPAETEEGIYFALSYRGKRVCIDSGLLPILSSFLQQPNDEFTRLAIDSVLAEFLKDYPALWYRCPRTGEVLELTRVTCTFVGTTVVLTPHYKVPNDQGMGRAPVHER